MKAKLCDECRAEIVTVQRGRRFVAECSYCGKPYEKGIVVEDFIPEYDGEDE